jgi:DedD protein
MGLLSIFQRQSNKRAKSPAAETNLDSMQEARARARRRLIGASVLVVIGVIGFPLLFETQPRPIAVDIPIEIPRKENSPPLAMPAARSVKPRAVVPSEPVGASAAQILTETQTDAGHEVSADTDKPASATAKGTSAPARHEAPEAARTTRAAKPAVSSASALSDGRRAQDMLEGKAIDPEKSKKSAGRFVVQVGAFADPVAARETRQKIEKLGLKTYTQVAQTSSGNRIRVRVGPFASREEADRAQAKIKAAGTTAVVLTL